MAAAKPPTAPTAELFAANVTMLRHKPSVLRKHRACTLACDQMPPHRGLSNATPSGGVPTRRGRAPAGQWPAGGRCGQAGGGPALRAGYAGAGGMFGGDGMDDGGGFGGFGGCGALL